MQNVTSLYAGRLEKYFAALKWLCIFPADEQKHKFHLAWPISALVVLWQCFPKDCFHLLTQSHFIYLKIIPNFNLTSICSIVLPYKVKQQGKPSTQTH